VNLCRPHSLSLLASLLLACLLLAGCAAKPVAPTAGPEEAVGDIVVLPVDISPDHSGRRTGEQQKELENGREVLDRLLANYFKERPELKIISQGEEEVRTGDSFSRSRLAAARTVATAYGAGAALVTTLYRFEERRGSRLSVISPASVAFDFKLIKTEDGQVLCSGMFDETQQALSENILDFFKSSQRKFRWIEAEELAAEGVRNKLGECPALRKNPAE